MVMVTRHARDNGKTLQVHILQVKLNLLTGSACQLGGQSRLRQAHTTAVGLSQNLNFFFVSVSFSHLMTLNMSIILKKKFPW